MGDEKESTLLYSVNNASKQQKVSTAVTVHSSLVAISAVCKEVTDMDRQIDPITSHTYRKQKSGKSTPPIWVPTPKTGVPIYIPTDRPGARAANIDDRMIHPKIFKQLQKLSNHTFTLDACTNSKGDNALCS